MTLAQIIKKYNSLDGKTVSRDYLKKLSNELFDAIPINEKIIREPLKKINKLLRLNPDAQNFELIIKKPIIIPPTKKSIKNNGLKGIQDEDITGLGIPYLSAEMEQEYGKADNDTVGLNKRVSNDDIYKMITNKFIKIIDKSGRLPWDSGFNNKPEKNTFSFVNLPINYQSSKYYRGINALVLSMYRYHTDETRGEISINSKGQFEEGVTEIITDDRLFWLTFKQIKEVGGKLKKDSLSQQAVYYNFIHFYKDSKISEKKYNLLKKQFGCPKLGNDNCSDLYKAAFLKYYNVFNERDIEGVDFEAKRKKLKLKSKEVKTKEQKILAADLVLKHMPLKPKLEVKFLNQKAGESPYYSPSLDRVVMPQKTQFDNLATWYGIAFHEHIHATGHAKRTDRRSIKGFTRGSRFGDTQYAIEELVAEIGSAFLNAESGILLENLKNNAAYVKGWAKGVAKHLKKDNKAIFIAAGQAQKAADYILDFDKNGNPKYWSEYEKIQKEIKAKGKQAIKTKLVKKSEPRSKVKAKKKQLLIEKLPTIKNKTNNVKNNCPKAAIIKHLKSMSREDFANDYAYVFSADLDKTIAWVETDDKVYNSHLKALADKACKEPVYQKVIGFEKPIIDNNGQMGLFGYIQTELLSVKDEFKNKSNIEVRKELKDIFQKFTGKFFSNHELKQKIIIDKVAKGKVMYGGKHINSKIATAIKYLPHLLTYGKVLNKTTPKPHHIKKYKAEKIINLESKIKIDGKTEYFILTVFYRRKDGLHYYIESSDIKKSVRSHSSKAKKQSTLPNGLSKNKDTIKNIPSKKALKTSVNNTVVKSSVKTIRQNNETGLNGDLKSVSNLVKKINHKDDKEYQYYNINSDFATFLGNIEIKPKESLAVTLDAPQGAGKTRAFFIGLNDFAEYGYKCLFISLEEHPESSLFKEKVAQYISNNAAENIDTIGNLPDDEKTLELLIEQYDAIFIDSWGKLTQYRNLDFDFDMRKKYNGKIFFVIFQRTQGGKMRGGSKAQFDGDVILKIKKEDNFKENYIYADKNRYQNKPLDELKYNIYTKSLIGGESQNKEEIIFDI